MGMTNEQLEATVSALEQEGTQFGTTFTDSMGNAHTILKDTEESLDDFTERVKQESSQIEQNI
jgi:hypothetical protein